MNVSRWIEYFTDRTREPSSRVLDWQLAPPDPERREIRLLARSLAIFQLGESGGGSRLLAYARSFAVRDARYAAYPEAVQLFVNEEHGHADLLKEMVRRLGGTLLRRQWTNTLFRSVRSLVNLEFNIQVLLSAELMARAYYGLLSSCASDPVIRAACRLITRDEAGHIAFHTDFFRDRLHAWPNWRAWCWRGQFRILFAFVRRVVWMDHGETLAACGISKEAFFRKSRRACQAFLSGTAGRSAEPAEQKVVKDFSPHSRGAESSQAPQSAPRRRLTAD